MINNIESKERSRENRDIDLRRSAMCLCSQRSGCILLLMIQGYITTYI
jgi:hypothetical protein